MPSKLHEDIVDDIREAVVNGFADIHPIMCAIDYMASYFMGYTEEETRPPCPDLAIRLGDGFGAIAVEVGKMDDGKWSEVIVSDDKPARVLRVGFDRQVYIIRPRGTQLETELIDFLQRYLTGQSTS